MIFKAAIIADIHFGAVPAKQLYYELQEEFIKFIKDRYLDMIVIAGDFYHTVTSLNSSTALWSIQFMNDLVETCVENGIRFIRIIEGTMSHDNYQINNFSIFESREDIDFRVITSVCEECVCGLKILYIPEEYKEDPKAYYKPFFANHKNYYDFIFGHGMFKETSFVTDDGENIITKAPILDSKLIGSICMGPIFFGHIHTPTVIRKHIYYVGSFSRWVYGQEEDKGFYLCVYDTQSKMYAVEFIVNKEARRYDTMKVLLDKFNKSPEDLIQYAKQLKVDNLRIQLIIESGERDYSYDISFLKEYYSGKQGYKLEVIDKREKLRQEQTEAKVNQLLTDYNFLFDNAIPVEVKIRKFIKRKYEKDVSDELIRNLLNLNTTQKRS